MFRLFKQLTTVDNGQLLVSELKYVQNGVLIELNKILKYYKTQVTSVNSDHILVRLIQSLPLQLSYPYQRYVDVAREASYGVSMSLQFTSPLSVGLYRQTSYFYGNNNHEIIIVNNDEFELDEAIANWKDLSPVRVLSHPFTDLNYQLANGRKSSEEKGLVCMTINIPMLMLQYRRWVESEKFAFGDAGRTLMQFVSMYVIPNILKSHIDHCYFNRLSAQLKQLPVLPFNNSHPFALVDYSSRIDRILPILNARLSTNIYDFADIVRMLPVLFNDNLWSIIKLPDGVINRQVEWAYCLSRLNLISYLLYLNRSSDSFKNREYMNQIKFDITRLRNDKGLLQRLPLNVQYMIDDVFERSILALL